MKYDVVLSPEAQQDLAVLFKSEPKAYAKALSLIQELYIHPTVGTGKPEQLRGNRSGQWSRRITKKHRLIYRVLEDKVYVYVLSAYGHY